MRGYAAPIVLATWAALKSLGILLPQWLLLLSIATAVLVQVTELIRRYGE